jgi:hypothetical protein
MPIEVFGSIFKVSLKKSLLWLFLKIVLSTLHVNFTKQGHMLPYGRVMKQVY